MANAVSALIGIMLAVVVGVAVTIPVVVDAIAEANLSGTTATIVGLIPLLILTPGLILDKQLRSTFNRHCSWSNGLERNSNGISLQSKLTNNGISHLSGVASAMPFI